MDWKTEIGTLLLSLLTFGTNDVNVWEHGTATNLSSFRKIPFTHNTSLVDPLKDTCHFMIFYAPVTYNEFAIFLSNHKVHSVRILVRPFEYKMPTANSECMFISFFLLTISVL